MNRDDIIRMAREAGYFLYDLTETHGIKTVETDEDDEWAQLERFAALIAAAEREKVAAWMIERSYATGHGDTTEDLLKQLEWQVRESEREACAKVCEADGLLWGQRYAAAIRARGEQA